MLAMGWRGKQKWLWKPGRRKNKPVLAHRISVLLDGRNIPDGDDSAPHLRLSLLVLIRDICWSEPEQIMLGIQ